MNHARLALAIVAMVLALAAAGQHIYARHRGLKIIVSPQSATIPCGALPGLFIASVYTLYGDGWPIKVSMKPASPFVLADTTPPTSVVVGPAQIEPPNCGTTTNLTVTADQP